MVAMNTSANSGLAAARITALYLLGGIAVGLGFALPISAVPTPGALHGVRNTASGVVMFAVLVIASRAWGRAIASQTGCPDPRRIGTVAALVFAPMLIAVGIVLGLLEPLFVRLGAAEGLPIHVVFTLLFVPSAFLVAGVTALAMGWMVNNVQTALLLALQTGAAAAVAFLAVDLFMDAIGWRVGAPGAARRATMLVVTLLGSLGAALAGGAVLGIGLSRTTPGRAPEPN